MYWFNKAIFYLKYWYGFTKPILTVPQKPLSWRKRPLPAFGECDPLLEAPPARGLRGTLALTKAKAIRKADRITSNIFKIASAH